MVISTTNKNTTKILSVSRVFLVNISLFYNVSLRSSKSKFFFNLTSMFNHNVRRRQMKKQNRDRQASYSDRLVTINEMIDLGCNLSWGDNIKHVMFEKVVFEKGAIQSFVENFNPRVIGKRVVFSFSNTMLHTSDIKHLREKFDHFTKLDFRGAGLNDDSVKIIAGYIKTNPDNITTVHLEYNRFGPAGHIALIDALRQNSYIDKLFLKNTHRFAEYYHDNARGSFKVVYERFAELLTENTSLRVVGLQEKYMPLEYMDILSKGIEKNQSLHYFSLGDSVFERDWSGKSTQRFTDAVTKQSIINHINESIFKSPTRKSWQDLKDVIIKNCSHKNKFLNAVKRCDMVVINQMLRQKNVNLNWTVGNEHYNALHLIAISNHSCEKITPVIKKLYENGFKAILYRRSGRCSNSIQPIELAKSHGHFNVAEVLRVIPAGKNNFNQANNKNRLFGARNIECRRLEVSDYNSEYPQLVLSK